MIFLKTRYLSLKLCSNFSFNIRLHELHKTIYPPQHSSIIVVGSCSSGSILSNLIPMMTPIKSLYLKLFTNKTFFTYQPGLELMANSLKEKDDIQIPVLKLMNEYFSIEFDNVLEYLPQENKILTLDREFTYDYLVIAEELENNFLNIKGLKEGIEDPFSKISSLIDVGYCEKTFNILENYFLKSQGKIIFYGGNTCSKNYFSTLNCLSIFENRLRKKNKNLRKKTELIYVTKSDNIYPENELFDKYLIENLKKRDIEIITSNTLLEIENNKNIIVKNILNKLEKIDFDILIAEPEYKMNENLKKSAFYDNKNDELLFNQNNLISKNYNNVFGIGSSVFNKIKTPLSLTEIFHDSMTICKNIMVTCYNQDKNKQFKYFDKENYSYNPIFIGNNKVSSLKYDNNNSEIINEGKIGYYKEILYYPWVYNKYIPKGKWFGRKYLFKEPDFEFKKI